MAFKLKRDDKVKVISGKAKGTEGRITRVLKEEGMVVVEGVNKVKRHTKPNRRNEKGGIIEKEMPIHVSNVMLIGKSGPVKVVRKRTDAGKLVRVEKKTGNAVE